jgi:hypothetical protein
VTLSRRTKCNCKSWCFLTSFSLGLDGFWFSLAMAGILGCISIIVFIRLSNQYGREIASMNVRAGREPRKKRQDADADMELDGWFESLMCLDLGWDAQNSPKKGNKEGGNYGADVQKTNGGSVKGSRGSVGTQNSAVENSASMNLYNPDEYETAGESKAWTSLKVPSVKKKKTVQQEKMELDKYLDE